MTTGRKVLKFLSSMKFALILLLILAAACAFGSFITQGQSYDWYAAAYSEQMAALIKLLSLDDVFHSIWFVGITLFLCVNLLLCNVLRVSGLVRQYRSYASPAKGMLIAPEDAPEAADHNDPETMQNDSEPVQNSDQSRVREQNPAQGPSPAAIRVPGKEEARKMFSEMGFHAVQESDRFLYASRFRIGLWGAWICHLGILLLIAGFGLGQMTKKEYSVYGVPGQSMAVGDTDYVVSIEDFRIGLREDDTVEQYTADITVRKISEGRSESASISVNHPATLFGMKFYQNSTSWAALATVLKDGEEIQQEVVCAGDYLRVRDKEGLVILLSAVYPDYYRDPVAGPSTRSSAFNNPGYLYRAYYMNQVIGMNVLTGDDEITIDEYTVRFSDPRAYTLIQIKQDRFTLLALLGGLVTMFGLILAFYLQPQRMWASAGPDGSWYVNGASRKGNTLFQEKLRNLQS